MVFRTSFISMQPHAVPLSPLVSACIPCIFWLIPTLTFSSASSFTGARCHATVWLQTSYLGDDVTPPLDHKKEASVSCSCQIRLTWRRRAACATGRCAPVWHAAHWENGTDGSALMRHSRGCKFFFFFFFWRHYRNLIEIFSLQVPPSLYSPRVPSA